MNTPRSKDSKEGSLVNTKNWRFTIRAIIGVAAVVLTVMCIVDAVRAGAASVSWFWAMPTVALIAVVMAVIVLRQAYREIANR